MHHNERDLVAPAAVLTSAMIGQMKMRATVQEAAAMFFEMLKALTDEATKPSVVAPAKVSLTA